MANIIRVKKNKNYSVISNICIRDKRLSAKAKGIHTYLLSLPDDWSIYISEIKEHFSDGISSITSGINELLEYGYITRLRLKDNKGRFAGYNYTVLEHPKADYPFTENPITGNHILPNTDLTKELTALKTNSSGDCEFFPSGKNSTSCKTENKSKMKNSYSSESEAISVSAITQKDNTTPPASVIDSEWLEQFSHSCKGSIELNRSAKIWNDLQKLNNSQKYKME